MKNEDQSGVNNLPPSFQSHFTLRFLLKFTSPFRTMPHVYHYSLPLLLPHLSQSMTLTSNVTSSALSLGMSNTRDSLQTGLSVAFLTVVFFFLIRRPWHSTITFTYGSGGCELRACQGVLQRACYGRLSLYIYI